MKANEIIEKKLKKYSAAQLISKLEKGNLPESEKEVAIEILEKRGQDVSKWRMASDDTNVEETVTQEPVKKKEISLSREELIGKVDAFVDTLIEDHRDGVYTEVMKALGGKFDSDIDELFENATEEQLKEALSFKKIKAKKEEPTQSKVQKKVEGKTEKVVKSKEEGKKEKKVSKIKKEKILQSSEVEDLKVGVSVCFLNKENEKIYGDIVKIFLSHKNNKEICKINIKDCDKFVHKRTNKLIKINE